MKRQLPPKISIFKLSKKIRKEKSPIILIKQLHCQFFAKGVTRPFFSKQAKGKVHFLKITQVKSNRVSKQVNKMTILKGTFQQIACFPEAKTQRKACSNN